MADLTNLKNSRVLIVCSAGGHLTEALILAKKMGILETSLFVTHDNEQSRSLLKNHQHSFVPYVKSRQLLKAIRVFFTLRKLSKSFEFEFILSTGAAISISALLLHFERRKPFFYNEGLTRVKEPSASGKILEYFSSVQLYSPHSHNFSSAWKTSPNLLESYVTSKRKRDVPRDLRIFVSLGTMAPFTFHRLIDDILAILSPKDKVIWQIGCTSRTDLPGEIFTVMANEDFLVHAKEADIVICHAGAGSLLDLISNGIRPIVVPRLSRFNEHIDDHQVELADYFQSTDLIFVPKFQISREDLVTNASYQIDQSH